MFLGLFEVVGLLLLALVVFVLARLFSAGLTFFKKFDPGAGKVELLCPHCQKPTAANGPLCEHCGQEL